MPEAGSWMGDRKCLATAPLRPALFGEGARAFGAVFGVDDFGPEAVVQHPEVAFGFGSL
jgi:hypothetical protein